jgi:hypothetical protein
MDRAKWIGSLVVAGLLAGPGIAVAQTMEAPPLSAALESCTPSALPAQRVASFVGSMPATKGADRMQMRFELLRRDPGEKLWHAVSGLKGFDVWESSMPARAGFVFHKRVDGLRVPASYRAVVRFRWRDADGAVVRSARKRPESCEQPDLRPELEALGVRAVLDARPAFALYTVLVRNDGRSPAGPFAVRVAGAVAEVAGLAAGEQKEVVILAPACARGSIVRAVVDADRRIEEADERNAMKRGCPLDG